MRLKSESRQPGMTATNHYKTERPELSIKAQRLGLMRRVARREIEEAQRRIHNLEKLLRRIQRSLP